MTHLRVQVYYQISDINLPLVVYLPVYSLEMPTRIVIKIYLKTNLQKN